MSTPTTRPGNGAARAGVHDDVPSYVAAVRARLDDLSPEEVEELTGGLEADLAEALAGFDETPHERFGDPAAYADELRAAADLPPRRAQPPTVLGSALAEARQNLVDSMDEGLEALRRHPWFVPVRDFLVVLRPAWWVLRAWVAVAVLRGMAAGDSSLLGGAGARLLLLLAIVGSVTIGRRSPLPEGAPRAALLVGNVLAVIALPLVVDHVSSPETVSVDSGVQQGLWMDGAEISDILPYDAQGRQLTGVQLFDGQGRPITVNEWWDAEPPRGPANVFPRPGADPDSVTQPDVPALEPTSTPTASVAPSATPSATPSAAATAAPTASASASAPGVTPTRAPTATPGP